MGLAVADILKIRRLLVRYAYLVDLEQVPEDAFLELYTDEAVIVHPQRGRFAGREGQKAYAHDLRRSRGGTAQADRTRHLVTNFIVEGDGDAAELKAFVLEYTTDLTRPGEASGFASVGHFECDVRRVGGRWRLAGQTLVIDHLTGTSRDKSETDHADVPLVVVPV